MALINKLLLWSAIAYDTVCAVPKLTLANGTHTPLIPEKVVIEYGKPLELYCTGHADNLEMNKNGEKLAITSVNETTVKFFAERPERHDKYYYCEDTQSKDSSGVRVVVDSPPMVADFKCKSHNLEYLNCSWTSTNVFPEFSLYYIKEEFAYNFLLCKLDMYASMYCVWETKNPSIAYEQFSETLTFLIETCNGFGCGNQTFVFNHAAIIQPEPPKLSLVWKGSRNASVRWSTPWRLWLMNYLYLEHKMTYWYPGIQQIEVDTKSMKEDYVETFEFELQLPCSDTYYEVRLSIKPETAEGDEFWSENATVSFVTDPEPVSVDAAVDPRCIRPRIPVTPEIMLYEIEKFEDKLKEEQNARRESMKLMKLRIAG